MAAGTISVNVQAKTAKAVGNLKKFQKSVRKTGKAARSGSVGVAALGGRLRMLAVAAGSAIGAGFTAKAFIATAAGIQKINDVSAKLGISVNHLRQLQHAANLTGVSTETLNMALQRQVRRIAEAAMGTGEAAAALKELGLDARALNRMSPYEQFRLIAEAMKGIPNQADKIRVSFKLWDSEGAALVTSLKGGAAGLDRIRRRFQRLGLEFSEIKVAQIERFNAAFAELRLVSETYGQQIVIAIAPGATRLVEMLSETVEGFRLIFKGMATFIKANPWIGKMGDTAKWLHEFGNPFHMAGERLGKKLGEFADIGMTGSTGKSAYQKFDDYMTKVVDDWNMTIWGSKGERWEWFKRETPPAASTRSGSMSAANQRSMARRTIHALESIDARTREQNEDLKRAKETVVRLGSIP